MSWIEFDGDVVYGPDGKVMKPDEDGFYRLTFAVNTVPENDAIARWNQATGELTLERKDGRVIASTHCARHLLGAVALLCKGGCTTYMGFVIRKTIIGAVP